MHPGCPGFPSGSRAGRGLGWEGWSSSEGAELVFRASRVSALSISPAGLWVKHSHKMRMFPQSKATEIKPNSKGWVTYLGNLGLSLDLMLDNPGKVSPTFLRGMSWGVMWPPKARRPRLWVGSATGTVSTGCPPKGGGSVLLILALDAGAGPV